jgi:hypothetical protein
MIYDVIENIIPIETKLFCSNYTLRLFMSGKLILYYLDIQTSQEVVELSVL